jgi:hypothetical protein
MSRLFVIVLLTLSVSLTWGATSALAVPGGVDGDEAVEQRPEQDDPDCAAGVLLVEQFCDVVDSALSPGMSVVTTDPRRWPEAASHGVLNDVTRWMTDAARWVTSKIQGLIAKTATPELEAQWYRERFGGMVALGGGLAVLVAMIALASAGLRRDPDALGATFIGCFGRGSARGSCWRWLCWRWAWRMASRIGWRRIRRARRRRSFGVMSRRRGAVRTARGLGRRRSRLCLRWCRCWRRSRFGLSCCCATRGSMWRCCLCRRRWRRRFGRRCGRGRRGWCRCCLCVLIAMKPVIVVVLSLAGSAAAAGGDVDKDLGLVVAAVMILVLAAFVPWVLMMLVSMDSEGSWTAKTATGSLKSSLGGGVSRVGGGLGGAANATGALANRRRPGMGGQPGAGGNPRGGGNPGAGGGNRGGGGPGGGGDRRGPRPTAPSAPHGPIARGTVSVAAGLVGPVERPNTAKRPAGPSRPRPAAPAKPTPKRQ